jgi:hypothetical protein
MTSKTLIIGLSALGLLLLTPSWLGWRYYKDRYPTWREEVRLADGRVVQVTHRHEVYQNYGTNQSWVTFTLPELGGERTWHSHLVPQRVDVADGRVYVFGAPPGLRQFKFYRKPKNYLVAFRWNGRKRSANPSTPSILKLRALHPEVQ